MAAAAENGWQLSVTRIIAAPPQVVWQVMTQQQAEWWCPKPWRAEIAFQQWRAGGRSSVIMHGPDGERHAHDGIFLEVVPGEYFVSTDAFVRRDDGHFMPAEPFMVGRWAIEPVQAGDATYIRYTATACHWDEASAKRHADMGFADGWGVCADQLAALCEGTC